MTLAALKNGRQSCGDSHVRECSLHVVATTEKEVAGVVPR